MSHASPICRDESRRDQARASALSGLDYVEVREGQTQLEVRFLGKAPPEITQENLVIAGGRRIRDIRITGFKLIRQKDPRLDDIMEIWVDKPGDFSTYTLKALSLDKPGQAMEGFDPRYAQVDFSFKANCPSDLDCQAPPPCPPPPRPSPKINYLAKDYASFRQLILDRLALILPDWRERHVPDLGLSLVELLAYVGDYLSYYQDAVATEAYLGTARQRISVRRHARLVDYSMHEGCNARAWVSLWTYRDHTFEDARQLYFITRYPDAPATSILTEQSLITVPAGSYEVFEPLGTQTIPLMSAHNAIHFYTWGDSHCCLPKGATTATLADVWREDGNPSPTPRALRLKPGDVLVFEEVLGARTGDPADADPSRRQAVRLTQVTPALDPLYPLESSEEGFPVLEIQWCSEDALAFPLCVSAQGPAPGCATLENISVARGNVVLVDHGAGLREVLGVVPAASSAQRCPTDCEPSELSIQPGTFRPKLKERPLTFAQTLPTCACAEGLIDQDPRAALPWISLQAIPPAPIPDAKGVARPLFSFDDLAYPLGLAASLKLAADVPAQYLKTRLSPATEQQLDAWDGLAPLPSALGLALAADLEALLETWTPRRDLLESGPNERVFVVEMDNAGYAHLRFGDGRLGKQPEAGTAFRADYRVGNGGAGNVGPEAIAYLVSRTDPLSGLDIRPRNPLPARGGTEPEPIAEVKRFAPDAFRRTLQRAITAEDYAALAADNRRRREERSAARPPGDPACLSPFLSLQGAKASLRWTGSWYESLVAIDPLGTQEASPELTREIGAYLAPYRRMGHDLVVKPAAYVPLDLALSVCVSPDYLRAHVEAALLDAFSNRALPDGGLGFFHPDNLGFGAGVYPSRIIATAQAIAGVRSVAITRLKRYEVGEPPPGVEATDGNFPRHGVLALGALEIARLDNDPSLPENGRFSLVMRGGR